MQTLSDNLILYHGSYAPINLVDLSKCKDGKDFGRGFYLTSSFAQAKSFIPMSVKKQVLKRNLDPNTDFGFVSVFKLHVTCELEFFKFDSTDSKWLHFIAANRKDDIFPEIKTKYKKYDIIAGKISNDQTAKTLQFYLNGAFGEPGTKIADDFAIKSLLPNRLEDQYCFCTEKAIQALEAIGCERYEFKR